MFGVLGKSTSNLKERKFKEKISLESYQSEAKIHADPEITNRALNNQPGTAAMF